MDRREVKKAATLRGIWMRCESGCDCGMTREALENTTSTRAFHRDLQLNPLGSHSLCGRPAWISAARPLLSYSVPQVYKYLSGAFTSGKALSVCIERLALQRLSSPSGVAGEAVTGEREVAGSRISR